MCPISRLGSWASAWEESGLLGGEEIQCSLQPCLPRPPPQRAPPGTPPQPASWGALPALRGSALRGAARPVGRRGSAQKAAQTADPAAAVPATPATATRPTVLCFPCAGHHAKHTPGTVVSPRSHLMDSPLMDALDIATGQREDCEAQGSWCCAGQMWQAWNRNPGWPGSHTA